MQSHERIRASPVDWVPESSLAEIYPCRVRDPSAPVAPKPVSVPGVWPNFVHTISLVDSILRPFRADPNPAARLPSGTHAGREFR
jgi:hypothetical protein